MRFMLMLIIAVVTLTQPALAKKAASPAKPVVITLPPGDEIFPPGVGAPLADQNCLGCHSADTVTNQPALPDGAWRAEIEKMRTVFKAQIPAESIDPLAEYLTEQQGVNRPHWR